MGLTGAASFMAALLVSEGTVVTSNQTNIMICPSCGSANIEGADTCENCMSDLRTIDVPATSQAGNDSDLNVPLLSVRLSKPCTVAPDTTIREVVKLLQGEPSGAVIVVENERVVGIFTERDVLKRVAGASILDHKVSRYMTKDPVVLREDDSINVALNKMGDGGFRHIPLVRDGELVAVATAYDAMQWVMGRFFD